MTRDPDELADAFLDGELPAEAWEAACAQDPSGCARALEAARTRRSVLAGLARPALPDELRQRLMTVTTPAATPGHPWWRYALPTALAAGLLATLLPLRTRAPSAPTREEIAQAHPAVTMGRAEQASTVVADPMPAASPAATEEAGAVQALAAPADRVSAQATAGEAPKVLDSGAPEAALAASAPPPASAGAAPAGAAPGGSAVLGAPSPLALHLAWRPPVQRRAADDRAAERRAPMRSSGTADASAAEAPIGRELLVTLRNQTVSDLTVAAGGIHLVGVAADGRPVWRTTLRGATPTLVPAGRSLSWVQPIAVMPPGVVRLRLEVAGQRSTAIDP